MNKDIDFNSKKFLILLLIVCLVFFVVIIKAFEYLPDSQSSDISRRGNIEDINQPAPEKETTQAEEAQVQEEVKPVAAEKKTLNIELPKTGDELENIEEIPSASSDLQSETEVNKTPELTPAEQAAKIFIEAQKYKYAKQYVKALEEYQKIPSVTSDVKDIAKSYEEIATIYAIVKRYGTALSYAQKAYNMSPSSSREMLLARLYYKTGDIDKATRRINNVLQRDFASDR